MNRKGVTFIELLIYMALFAIVSLFLGKLFKSLVNNYSSGTRIVRQQTDMRDILGLMVREIRNTGLKTYLTGTGPFTKNTADNIIVEIGTDSSSFVHTQAPDGEYNDSLTIKKIVLDKDGDYTTSDTAITYYVQGTTLRRDLKTTDAYNTNSMVAENVYALQFEYGILKSNTSLVTQDPITASDWNLPPSASNPTKTGTTEISLSFNGAEDGYLRYYYTSFLGFDVEQHQKYRVVLDITASGGFPEALDHMSVSFRTSSKANLGSEDFLPYSGIVELIVPIHTTGTAFPWIEYDATGSGNLLIKSVDIRLDEEKEYTWSFNPTTTQKKHVRAIRVSVLVRSKGETGLKADGPITVGDVSVPRDGEYSWRLYKETIETPNNGVF